MKLGARTTVVVAFIASISMVAACTGARVPKSTTVLGSGKNDATSTTVAGDAAATATTTANAGDPFGGPATTLAKSGATTRVTSPNGGPGTSPQAQSTLFNANENNIGITPNSITLCAHAALTYAAAFDTSADDLSVFWDALNDKGGIFGRKVSISFENDDYKPDTAVVAATACKAKNPFFLLGGIGFDQIPSVRNWAETNHMLYVHHTATVNGTANQHYSFTGLPSTEKVGAMFGELAASRFRNKKIGIIKRNSPNWEPGVAAFKVVAKKYGLNIVAERTVEYNQGNYTQEVIDMKNAGADVVFGWENALASTLIVRQAKNQNYSPTWMLFPFNLTSQTLMDAALSPKMVGVAMYPAYSKGDYTGTFAPYAADMKEFEAEYAHYRPNAKLDGVAGDLLFLNWTGMKGLALLLQQCGPDCNRNRLVDVMTHFKATHPFPSSCDVDFTRPGFARMGGFDVNIMETYRAPDGHVNWHNTDSCVEHLL